MRERSAAAARLPIALVLLALGAASPAAALDPRLVLREVPPEVSDKRGKRGNFRILCDFSHAAYDDPIVHPRRPGKSHYHFFFGNTLTDAWSNTTSLRTRGESTCQGQTLNRSAYWIPAVFDASGRPRPPDTANFYYKNQTLTPPSEIQVVPEKLRMIAGNPDGNDEDAPLPEASWRCTSGRSGDDRPRQVAMPTCAVGEKLLMNVTFPDCWDKKNYSSEDQSHVAYAVWTDENDESGNRCPSTHPYVMPQIAFQFAWELDTQTTEGWYLASDLHHGGASHDSGRHGKLKHERGTTLHGDWWNGWKDETMKKWVMSCLHGNLDCGNGNLGDGTALAERYAAGRGLMARPAGSNGSWCNGRRATIVGTDRADVIRGTAGDDVVVARGGNDDIETYGGRDVICAGDGDDRIDAGDGDDEVRAGRGNDVVAGGKGRDRVYGDDGDDRLDGDEDADVLYGGWGEDVLRVGAGGGWAFGEGGRDILYGDYGANRLFGGGSDDELYGVGGNSLIDGGPGADVCDPGNGGIIAVLDCPDAPTP